MTKKAVLPDIMTEVDERGVFIDKVGIRKVRIPFKVKMRNNTVQDTTAEISCYIGLHNTTKGTHMSRFSEIISKYADMSDEEVLQGKEFIDEVLGDLLERLETKSSYIKIKFPLFLKQAAPESEKEAYIAYDCILSGSSVEGKITRYLEVKVPYLSCCPCSKEISEYGAHMQRSYATVKILYEDMLWIEDLIPLVEKCDSSRIFNLLKRVDEKYVTEKAYENPKFVEDMGRDVALELDKLDVIKGYVIVMEHEESIHQHNAVAVVRGGHFIN